MVEEKEILSQIEIEKILDNVSEDIDKVLNEVVDKIDFPVSVVVYSGLTCEEKEVPLDQVDIELLKEALVEYGGWTDPIGQIRDWMYERLKEFTDWISSAVDTLLEPIRDKLDGVFSKIESVFSYVTDKIWIYIQDIYDYIKDIPSKIDSIISSLGDIGSKIESLFSTIKDIIKDAISGFVGDIISAVKGLEGKISTFIELVKTNVVKPVKDLLETVPEYIKNLPKYAVQGIENVSDWIWEHIPDWVKKFLTESIPNALKSIGDALQLVGVRFTGFINAILKFPEWFPNWFKEHISRPISEALEKLGSWIWEHIPDSIKSFFERAKEFFTKDLVDFFTKTLPEKFSELSEAIKSVPEKIKEIPERLKEIPERIKEIPDKIKETLEHIAETIWEHIPESVRNFIETSREFVTTLYDKFKEFIEDPKGKMYDFLKGIGEKLLTGMEWIWDKVKDLFNYLKQKTIDIGRTLSSWAISGAKSLKDFFSDMFSNLYVGVTQEVVPKIVETFLEKLEEAFKSEKGGEFYLMSSFVPAVYQIMYPIIIIPATVKGIAKATGEQEVNGIFGKIRVKVGEIASEVAETMKTIAMRTADEIALGLSFNVFEPLRYMVRPLSKRLLTPLFEKHYGIDAFFELPSFGELRELLQRHFPITDEEKKEFKEMMDYMTKVLDIRGLPSSFVEKIMKTVEDWKIVVKDRFGVKRNIPLSPLYDQPSLSDVCTFMIRDLLSSPEDFRKWITKLGMYKDVGIFYLLLHYRYPSPERLAEFFWRGVAGELWNPDNTVDEAVMKAFGIDPATWKAKAPKDMNFQIENLRKMLSIYMKWHDYARIPWIKDAPTDNAIVQDLLADIPGKIDLRWMSRWGLFDYWGAKNIGVTDSIEKITTTLVKPDAKTQAEDVIEYIKRQLEAETPTFDIRQFCRTLQATGLHPFWVPWIGIAESINALTEERTLLRTGFMNLYEEGILDLSGLNDLLSGFFTVTFKVARLSDDLKKWIESEVEVPIAFLPAESKLMQLRSIFDRAISLVRDYISVLRTGVREWFITPDDAIEKLKQFVEAINKHFFTSEVKKVSGKKLSLKLDEGFLNSLKDYFEDLADLSTTKMEVMPTPSQIASFAEYIDVPKDIIEESLKVRRFKDKIKKLWKDYISRRAVASETNQVASTFRRLYEYFNVSEEEVKKIKEILAKGGWTKGELPLFDMDLKLRKKYRILSYLVPTIRGAVGDAYYLPKSDELIESVCRARGIDIEKYKDHVDYYKRLVKMRKIYRRLSSYITELVNDYASRVIEEDYLRSRLEELKKYGIEEEEIEIIIKTAKHRRMRYDKIYGQGGGGQSSTPSSPSPPSPSSTTTTTPSPIRPVPRSQLGLGR
ncbi:hypothetical protein DRN38_00100 [Thermococci archaeon]|nr:MAG: hypothetical protein DRN38_00100 [Thermococci archaeon]